VEAFYVVVQDPALRPFHKRAVGHVEPLATAGEQILARRRVAATFVPGLSGHFSTSLKKNPPSCRQSGILAKMPRTAHAACIVDGTIEKTPTSRS
jgi:hypothetical protein